MKIHVLYGTGNNAIFLHTGLGYSRVLPGPTILISPLLSHTGLNKNHAYLMHMLYRKSDIYVVK